MRSPFDVRPPWNTAWSGAYIVVSRDGAEVDRLHAPEVSRIVFVQPSRTVSAGDLCYALVELSEEFVVFPAETGFAGRVHFERQAFWASKGCIYWADAAAARLPARWMQRRGFGLARSMPRYGRVPRVELAPVVERWALEGPQSWDERRWQRIERGRPFSRLDPHREKHVPTAHGRPR